VRKQGFEKGRGNTISPRFGNWTKHLKDMHGIENEGANVKANQQAQVARSIVNKHELFTSSWENGRDATVAAYHLLLARTINNMGLPAAIATTAAIKGASLQLKSLFSTLATQQPQLMLCRNPPQHNGNSCN
jgi:hypothetical protein